VPLARLSLGHADDLGGAEGREAVHEGDAELTSISAVWRSGGRG